MATTGGTQLTQNVALVGDIKTYTPGQIQKVLLNTIARTDTSAKTLGVIPAGAIMFALEIVGPAVSNAGTTATISVGKSGGNGHDYLNAYDVKGSTGAGQYQPSGVTLDSGAEAANVTITGTYAETGTASSAGGPWTVALSYVTV